MLRMSRIDAEQPGITLRLEGQLQGRWVEELRQVCAQCLATEPILRLDLQDVSFIDPDGVALCRQLRHQQVTFLHGSLFVLEQLKG